MLQIKTIYDLLHVYFIDHEYISFLMDLFSNCHIEPHCVLSLYIYAMTCEFEKTFPTFYSDLNILAVVFLALSCRDSIGSL